jgi:hypothetical protein
MSLTPLSIDDLLRRIAGMVGRLDAGVLNQPLMCLDHGYVSRPWICVPGKCPTLLLFCVVFFTFLVLTLGIFVRPQGLRNFKTSRPPVPEDVAGRTARRLAAEKDKEKKDAEKAQARERMRAREALEKRRRRQARDGLPLEPSPDTPDDDDDDDDDDEDDDMAARLGLSPDPRLGQRSSSQPPGGPAPPAFGVGTLGSRPEERRRAEGVLDPLAEIIGVTPGGSGRTARPSRASACASRMRSWSLDCRDVARAGRPLGASGVRGGSGVEAGCGTTLRSVYGGRGPRGLLTGTIDLALERVSI